ncbi:MAG: FAD:protein FMN transferase [Trebonia sp.]
MTAPRTVHVEHCMGTVFSIDIRDPGAWAGAVKEVIAWLHDVDAIFSTYKEGSDISRIRRGDLPVGDADPLVPEVLALCERAEKDTNGFFTARWRDAATVAAPADPASGTAGDVDPTGIVKGWAIERASGILRGHGSGNHCVNGGGDIQLAGEPSPGEAWRVGISDPRDRTRLVAVVAGRDTAVATSGTAERGDHIVDPRTGLAPDGLESATVTGPSLTLADAYATAAFVMGPAALDWVAARPGYEAMLVAPGGALTRTPGFPGQPVALPQ